MLGKMKILSRKFWLATEKMEKSYSQDLVKQTVDDPEFILHVDNP